MTPETPEAHIVAASAQKRSPSSRYKRRADGLYQLEKRYTLPDGLRKRKSFYGKTQAEAAAKRKAFERELASGRDMARADVTVAQYADAWLSGYRTNVAPKTLTSRAFDVGLLARRFGGLLLRHITLSHVQAVMNARAGLSRSAVSKTAAALRALFAAACAERILAHNPCDGLVIPDAASGSHRALSDEERLFVTRACPSHRFYLAAMVMLYAGLRRGEAMALHIARDVDFAARVIRVTQSVRFDGNQPRACAPKSAAGRREVPILPPLLGMLEARRGGGLILGNGDGSLMSQSGFQKVFGSYRRALEAARRADSLTDHRGAPAPDTPPFRLQCHDLRHTFCSLLYDAGVDVKTAQLWMGHADPMVTMRVYTHLSDRKRAAAVCAAESYFARFGGDQAGDAPAPMD